MNISSSKRQQSTEKRPVYQEIAPASSIRDLLIAQMEVTKITPEKVT